MSRKRKAPDYQIDKIRKKGQEHENFFRIYRSLFESEAFQTLPSTAKVVYIAIALQCGREDAHQLSCLFPESQFKQFFSKRQWEDAVPKLEEHGFIQATRRKSRTPNAYRLIDEWKNYKSVTKM